jgi:hypothetical protein
VNESGVFPLWYRFRLKLRELYTGSYRQQRVYRDKQTSALTGRTWTPPGLLLQESSSVVTQCANLMSGGSALLTFDTKSLNHKTE